MRVGDIQPYLATILGTVAALASNGASILVDDGLQNVTMEDLLKDVGLAILIMTPQAMHVDESARGGARLEYSCALFVRTNPKVKQAAPSQNLGSDGFGKTIIEFTGLTVGATYTLTVDGVVASYVATAATYQVTCVDSAMLTLDSAPAWNPLALEDAILCATMQWSKGRGDLGFRVTKDAPPETDWMDTGNNSRLIRFSTSIVFQ